MLNTQYRMFATLSCAISNMFYNGQLNCGKYDTSGLLRLHTTKAMPNRLTGSKSLCNAQEADVAAIFANKHFAAGGSTALLTFYKDQKQLLEKRASPGVSVLTVDASQGQEFEHVVLSCTVDGSRWSFLHDQRRMNVALSRAKKTLDIVCHENLLSNLPAIVAMRTASAGKAVPLGLLAATKRPGRRRFAHLGGRFVNRTS